MIKIEENYIEEQKEESVIVEQKQQKQAGRSSYSAAKTNYAYVAPISFISTMLKAHIVTADDTAVSISELPL